VALWIERRAAMASISWYSPCRGDPVMIRAVPCRLRLSSTATSSRRKRVGAASKEVVHLAQNLHDEGRHATRARSASSMPPRGGRKAAEQDIG
jgi:hypothetical protein